ncbi:hypothetical protein GCM10027341_27280 [Spirosoma knui]
MTALQILNRLADQHKAAKYPNVPSHARVKSHYSDKSANELTTAIVDFINLSGGFATRLASTGTFRADLQMFVPSKQLCGLPDVMVIIQGHSAFVEVKFGRDRLSDDQREAIALLNKAGARCFIASDFQGFYDWLMAQFGSLLLV